MRVPWVTIFCLTVAAVGVTASHGCGRNGSAEPGPAWDVDTPRTLSYQLDIAGTPGGTGSTPLGLVFEGGGRVRVTLDGKDVGRFTMSRSGRLTPEAPGTGVPIYLELFSMLPDRPRDLERVGSSWTRQFPADAPSRPGAIVYRSELTAKVTSVGEDAVAELEGTGSLVDNQGLRDAVAGLFGANPSPDVKQLLASYSAKNRYLTGTLRFDRKGGQVREISVSYVKFPDKSLTPAEIVASPARESMTWKLR